MTQGWRRQHERPGDDHIHITMVTIDMWKTWLPGAVHTQRHTSASHVSGKCSGVQQFNTKVSWHISPLHWKAIGLIQLGGQLVIWWSVRRVPTSWRSHKWSISVLRSRCWVLIYHTCRSKLRLYGRHDIITMYGPRTMSIIKLSYLCHREIYLLQYSAVNDILLIDTITLCLDIPQKPAFCGPANGLTFQKTLFA